MYFCTLKPRLALWEVSCAAFVVLRILDGHLKENIFQVTRNLCSGYNALGAIQ